MSNDNPLYTAMNDALTALDNVHENWLYQACPKTGCSLDAAIEARERLVHAATWTKTWLKLGLIAGELPMMVGYTPAQFSERVLNDLDEACRLSLFIHAYTPEASFSQKSDQAIVDALRDRLPELYESLVRAMREIKNATWATKLAHKTPPAPADEKMPPTNRAKSNGNPGKGNRGSQELIRAAFNTWHKYQLGCKKHELRCEPISGVKLTRLAKSGSENNASLFFKEHFGDATKYKTTARNPDKLFIALRRINGEMMDFVCDSSEQD